MTKTKRQTLSYEELTGLIEKGENEMHGVLSNLWDLIKIKPAQWTEATYGNEGEGFWVVAIFGNNVVWYNDIEQGFNTTRYSTAGHIDEYAAETDAFNWAIHKILVQLKMERRIMQ
jgi:hypothetical protein